MVSHTIGQDKKYASTYGLNLVDLAPMFHGTKAEYQNQGLKLIVC